MLVRALNVFIFIPMAFPILGLLIMALKSLEDWIYGSSSSMPMCSTPQLLADRKK